MRVLVTGANGFVGRHLVQDLIQDGHNVIMLDTDFGQTPHHNASSIIADLRNTENINDAVASSRPDACIHLGGISFVPSGQSDPDLMLSVNIKGTMNVLNAFHQFAPKAKILLVSTSQVYGATTAREPIKEDAPLLPVSIYGISKTAADLAGLAYAKKYNMHIMTARPNNHTGPGQSNLFVIPSFISQLKSISLGKQKPVMEVGNLKSVRNFCDVRDVVRAYRQLIEKGAPGEAYNISSQEPFTVEDILKLLCKLVGVKPEIKTDPDKFRPTDRSPVLDVSKLANQTGWKTEIPLIKTFQDMMSEIN